MNRFGNIEYDETSKQYQQEFKSIFMALEEAVTKCLDSPRSKAVALTKLEEAFFWVGAAIRDDQISRNGVQYLKNKRDQND